MEQKGGRPFARRRQRLVQKPLRVAELPLEPCGGEGVPAFVVARVAKREVRVRQQQRRERRLRANQDFNAPDYKRRYSYVSLIMNDMLGVSESSL